MRPYSRIEVCLHLEGTYCWYISRASNRQSKKTAVNFYQTSITFHKMALFIFTSLRTSNFTDISSLKFYLLCIVILSRKAIISRTKNEYFRLPFLPANQLFWKERQLKLQFGLKIIYLHFSCSVMKQFVHYYLKLSWRWKFLFLYSRLWHRIVCCVPEYTLW
jgi:hypothetical protein